MIKTVYRESFDTKEAALLKFVWLATEHDLTCNFYKTFADARRKGVLLQMRESNCGYTVRLQEGNI